MHCARTLHARVGLQRSRPRWSRASCAPRCTTGPVDATHWSTRTLADHLGLGTKLLRLIDRPTPTHLRLHLIVDNFATHSHLGVQAWLARHPRLVMHFTPTSASWLNMVEHFFRDITDKRIRRDGITSVAELGLAIDLYVAQRNIDPKPFICTASAVDILAKVTRAKAAPSTAAE